MEMASATERARATQSFSSGAISRQPSAPVRRSAMRMRASGRPLSSATISLVIRSGAALRNGS
jgi:hypothetical protein